MLHIPDSLSEPVCSYFCLAEEMLLQTRGLLVLIFLNQIVAQSDNRLSRRQRILSILESYQESSSDPTVAATRTRFNFSPARSGAAVEVNHYRSGWGGGTAPPHRTPPPSTVEPPESPYDLWYYQDDSNYIQGPFTSSNMLEWQKAGYFRSELANYPLAPGFIFPFFPDKDCC